MLEEAAEVQKGRWLKDDAFPCELVPCLKSRSVYVAIDLPPSSLDAETFQLLSYCTVIHQLPLVFFLSRDVNFMLERQACLAPLSPALKGGVAVKPQD
jgi:hypothetical protein